MQSFAMFRPRRVSCMKCKKNAKNSPSYGKWEYSVKWWPALRRPEEAQGSCAGGGAAVGLRTMNEFWISKKI